MNLNWQTNFDIKKIDKLNINIYRFLNKMTPNLEIRIIKNPMSFHRSKKSNFATQDFCCIIV